jgi:REP element-mobilizing transposase RayT
MSFWRTFYHLVWATKNREPMITPAIEPRLFAYLIHKAAELGAYTYAVNGWHDHVHMIVTIPPHVSVAELVKSLKGASSHDLNQQQRDEHFAWQRGYGVLTIGQRQRPAAEAYVKSQKEHHAGQTAIAWLETCAEDDAGPTDRSGQPLQPVPALHDERPRYVVSSDEPPF